MKTFIKPFLVLLLVFLAAQANAQYMQISNFSGTTAYGTSNVTVTPGGSFSTGGGTCFGAPLEYWAGPGGPGWYDYVITGSPAYVVKVRTWGINGGPVGTGEYVRMTVNGSVYPLQPSDVISYVECSPGGGPMYLNLGDWMGPVGTSSNYNGGTFTCTICTGINSFRVYCNGSLSGVAYHVFIDTTRPPSCVHATNNSPCYGDTLKLDMIGDTTGATYFWRGPGGFTSTIRNPFIYPATFADSGDYICIRYVGVVNDTDTTHVTVHPKPVVTATNNSPLCENNAGTLLLFANPYAAGDHYLWSGPTGFSAAVQNPMRSGFTIADTGLYAVILTDTFGCKDTADTRAVVVPQPPPPVISGHLAYCQNEPFVPFTISAAYPVLWYSTGTGGVGTPTPPTVPTATPGVYTYWATQTRGSCESERDSIVVRVIGTPLAPVVTGTLQYCQFIGPLDTLHVALDPTGIANWYTVPTGGTRSPGPLFPNLNVAGTYDFYISQTDSTGYYGSSGCEGPRTHVAIVVHPKPAPPTPVHDRYCQYWPGHPATAITGTPGGTLTWYGPYDSTLRITGFAIPQTDTVKIDTFFVTETTIYGCESNRARDTIHIIAKPEPPVTTDTAYCQFDKAAPLSVDVDSLAGSFLSWYVGGVKIDSTPIPNTSTPDYPGGHVWFVTQTINGCSSDSALLRVNIIYKPQFEIEASSPFVCQFDSLTLKYKGPALNAPDFLWSLPTGAHFTHFFFNTNDSVHVQFDSSHSNTYVYLHVTDNHGKCFGDDTLRIKVVPQPTATPASRTDVCLGDTVSLALTGHSMNSFRYEWTIDSLPFGTSSAVNIIAHNSNSGGPFLVSWIDSGIHHIGVTTWTEEGCISNTEFDSIAVHLLPDARFNITMRPGQLCIEDSVLFSAVATDYNYSYLWAPAHFFTNLNSRELWGRVELLKSVVSLTVTDPFGCSASTEREIDPNACCTVTFPSAFTPNGDGKNDVFRPIRDYKVNSGYERFHNFRIANRWGQTVFDAADNTTSWDGTWNGVPQDMGVYYYYVKFDCNGQVVEQNGDVTLVR